MAAPRSSSNPFAAVQALAEKAKKAGTEKHPRYTPKDLYTEKGRVLHPQIDEAKKNAQQDLNNLAMPAPAAPAEPYADRIAKIYEKMDKAFEQQFKTVVNGGNNKKADWQQIAETAKTELKAVCDEMKAAVVADPAKEADVVEFTTQRQAEIKAISDRKIDDEMKHLQQTLENQKMNNKIADLARDAAIAEGFTHFNQLSEDKILWSRHGDVDPEEKNQDAAFSLSNDDADYERKLKNLIEGGEGVYKRPGSDISIKLEKGANGQWSVSPVLPAKDIKEAYSECVSFLKVKAQATVISVNYAKPQEALQGEEQVKNLLEIMKLIEAKGASAQIPDNVRAQLLSLQAESQAKWKITRALGRDNTSNLVDQIFAIETRGKEKQNIGTTKPAMKEKATASIDELKKQEPERKKISDGVAAVLPPPADAKALATAVANVAKTVVEDGKATLPEKIDVVVAEVTKIEARLAELSMASARLSGQLNNMNEMANLKPEDKFLDPVSKDPAAHIAKLEELRDQIQAEVKDLSARQRACTDILQEVKSDAGYTALPADKKEATDKSLTKLTDTSANSMSDKLTKAKVKLTTDTPKIANHEANITDIRARAAAAQQQGIKRPGQN
jgi:hypothetical protein